jgi:peptide deformylase
MHIQENSQIIVMYNPQLKHASQEQWMAPEGCLSFPGVELEIARPKYATAQWQDRDGTWQERMFQGIDAKCFLHELDHLNGLTFKNHVSDLRFQTAVKRARKR